MARSASRQHVPPNFCVAHIASYLSRFMALRASVITTDTPPGVAVDHKPLLFLKAGDRVELGSQMLAEQRQEVVAVDDERERLFRR